MRLSMLLTLCIFCVFSSIVNADDQPEITNVTASQREDGSGIVDIKYTLSNAESGGSYIQVQVSDDGGTTWTVKAASLSGDVGSGVTSGSDKHIIWDSMVDLPGVYGENFKVKLITDDMTWVYVNDSGFTGYMSKYETTNQQYCNYLNTALASGDIYVTDGIVYGNSGTYSGEIYFETYESYSSSQISYNGTFSVRTRDGYSMANHPVVCVSWYGAMSFCEYYGYRLPTKLEWQAVADYNGSYTYGCGTTINPSKANFRYYDGDQYQCANPLGLTSYPYTSPVGYYPAYGYGLCDMAGNVWEWTSSLYSELRGGSWGNIDDTCLVSYRSGSGNPSLTYSHYGFRVCR